ncbi:hypothetical protein GQ472_01935 [archaeon]|nr:hypothetical protein [archaeon]
MLRCLLLGHDWLYYDKAQFIRTYPDRDVAPVIRYKHCKRRCIRCRRKEETVSGGIYGMKWKRIG